MPHPFADHIALRVAEQTPGQSRCELTIARQHLNPHGVVHGAVMFALADTGMGSALYPMLNEGETCATIGITIHFLRPATQGTLECETRVLSRGRSVANLDSRVTLAGTLVATATGSYAIIPRKNDRP